MGLSRPKGQQQAIWAEAANHNVNPATGQNLGMRELRQAAHAAHEAGGTGTLVRTGDDDTTTGADAVAADVFGRAAGAQAADASAGIAWDLRAGGPTWPASQALTAWRRPLSAVRE